MSRLKFPCSITTACNRPDLQPIQSQPSHSSLLSSKVRHKFLAVLALGLGIIELQVQLLQQSNLTLNTKEKHSLYLVWWVHWRAEVENKDHRSPQGSWLFHLYIVTLVSPETKSKPVFVRNNINFKLGFKLPQPPHPIINHLILHLVKYDATQGETCLCLNPAFTMRVYPQLLPLTSTNRYRSMSANCKKGWRAHWQWVLGLSNPGLTYTTTFAMYNHPCWQDVAHILQLIWKVLLKN